MNLGHPAFSRHSLQTESLKLVKRGEYWTMKHNLLRLALSIIAFAFVGIPLCSGLQAQTKGGAQNPGAQPVQSPAHKYFTDTPLMDQDGRRLRFYTDLLEGKVVVINSFFSSCTDSCPVMSGTLAKIQDWLGDRIGKEAFLISISVDPQTDSPLVLKQYAQRFKARPGWSFLTGNPQDVEFVLQKLGQYVGVKEDHMNIFIIGNERTGLWKKAFGLARPGDIIKVVDSVLSDKN
jgi:protein SCO1/2